MSRTFAGLALLIAACGSADQTINRVFDPCEPLVLEPDGSVTVEERSSAIAAAGLWNALVGAELSIEARPDAARVGLKTKLAAGNFFGAYDDENAVVIINRRLADSSQRTVTIAHELGHAMGLEHVDPSERASVMNPGNVRVLPNEADRAVLTERWGVCEAAKSAG